MARNKGKDNTGTREQKLRELHAKFDKISLELSRKKCNVAFSNDGIKKAIRKQNRQYKRPPSLEPIVYHRDLPQGDSLSHEINSFDGFKMPLEEAVDGAEVQSARGSAFMVCQRIDDLSEGELSSGSFRQELCSKGSNLCLRMASVCGPIDVMPDDIVFVDIETTGLGNSPLFLIGTMVWSTDGLEVRQYFARDYSEEAAVISSFVETCTSKKLLITFNGKSFDLPYIRTRAIVNGIQIGTEPVHFDLLHECRRIWKGALPDCKLKTLEKHICKRSRYGDIPSDQIPEAYHAYVRTEDARRIVEVIRHNMMDLVTLADLMTRFPSA